VSALGVSDPSDSTTRRRPIGRPGRAAYR